MIKRLFFPYLILVVLSGFSTFCVAAPVLEPGFPVTLEGRVLYSSAVIADINGNGYQEIIVAGEEGRVYCYDFQGNRLWHYQMILPVNGVPAVGDMNRDGYKEVVVGCGDQSDPKRGDLVLLSHTGSVLWKKEFRLGAAVAPEGNNGIWSSPAMRDLNIDGEMEIIVTSWNGRVYAFRYDGSSRWTNPYPNCGLSTEAIVTAETQYSSAALGDLDLDGYPEVALGLDVNPSVPNSYWTPFYTDPSYRGALLVLNRNSTLHMDCFIYNMDSDTGPCGTAATDNHIFKMKTNHSIWSAPALGDIDGDGYLEIISSTAPCDAPLCDLVSKPPFIYAWNHDGSPVSGWPVAMPEHSLSSPALGDLTGDGIPEVVVGCDDEQVYAFRGNGSLVPGWPVRPTSPWGGAKIRSSPVIADIDGDNQPEVLVSARWSVYVFKKTGGLQVDSLTMDTGNDVAGSCAVGDVDNDGFVEVVAASGDYNNCAHTCGKLYVWDTGSPVKPQQWPMFHQNACNTGLHQNHNAEFIRSSIPFEMNAGRIYNTTVTFKNNGVLPWRKLDDVTLQSLTVPEPLAIWGICDLAPGEVIQPGEEKSFAITFTPGNDDIGLKRTQWKMHLGTTPFGDQLRILIFINPSSVPVDRILPVLILLFIPVLLRNRFL